MSDSYLLLTPFLVLGVLALIRFIGCNWVFGLDPTVLGLDPPGNVVAAAGDQSVEVSWIYPASDAESFTVIYGTTMGGPYPEKSDIVIPDPSGQHRVTITSLVNGTTYFFKVTGESGDSGAVIQDSAEVSAVPGVTSFVVSATLGVQRNDFTGWVGMAVGVGASPVVVTQLGRIVGPANVRAHVVKIVDAGAGGVDLASVTIQMPAAPVREFAFVGLSQPVTLLPFRQYFVVSHEEANGDIWFDIPTVVVTTAVASVSSGVFNDDAAPGFTFAGGANETYVPVNFRY